MKQAGYVLALGVVLMLLYRAVAQETNRIDNDRIFVGQSLEAATNVLKNRGIKFDEGGFAFARTDPDRSNLYFNLDPNHADVCASFSKSKSTITGISLVFYPARKQRSKSGEAWISANEILLLQNRSYSVTFTTPITEEELKRAEDNALKNQYPQLTPSK
jgi:hypothetical protein